MPFRRNLEREADLLGHWKKGSTVKAASLLTGIPEGSVGYYYARFNRRNHSRRKLEPGAQEPPRSSPFDVALATLSLDDVNTNVLQMVQSGDFAKARDYLQLILLYADFARRITTVVQNQDPKRTKELFQNFFAILAARDIIRSGGTKESVGTPSMSSP